MAEGPDRKRVVTILAADVVGYSRLMGEDAPATVESLQECRELIAQVVKAHGGRIFGVAGDSEMACFAEALPATEAAIALQEAFSARNARLPDDRRMAYRLGLDRGPIIEDGEGIYGDGVNVAARVAELGRAGAICLSGAVFEEIHGRLACGYAYLGDQAYKNIARQVPTYRLRLAPRAIGTMTVEKVRRGPGHWRVIAAGLFIVGLLGTTTWYLVQKDVRQQSALAQEAERAAATVAAARAELARISAEIAARSEAEAEALRLAEEQAGARKALEGRLLALLEQLESDAAARAQLQALLAEAETRAAEEEAARDRALQESRRLLETEARLQAALETAKADARSRATLEGLLEEAKDRVAEEATARARAEEELRRRRESEQRLREALRAAEAAAALKRARRELLELASLQAVQNAQDRVEALRRAARAEAEAAVTDPLPPAAGPAELVADAQGIGERVRFASLTPADAAIDDDQVVAVERFLTEQENDLAFVGHEKDRSEEATDGRPGEETPLRSRQEAEAYIEANWDALRRRLARYNYEHRILVVDTDPDDGMNVTLREIDIEALSGDAVLASILFTEYANGFWHTTVTDRRLLRLEWRDDELVFVAHGEAARAGMAGADIADGVAPGPRSADAKALEAHLLANWDRFRDASGFYIRAYTTIGTAQRTLYQIRKIHVEDLTAGRFAVSLTYDRGYAQFNLTLTLELSYDGTEYEILGHLDRKDQVAAQPSN